MILDLNLEFDPSTAITTTRDSTNIIDLGNPRDLGVGTPLVVMLFVTQAFVSAGGATLAVSVRGSADNVTYYDLIDTQAFSVAKLNTSGTGVQEIALPMKSIDMPNNVFPRYLKLVYTVAVSSFSAGKIQAELVQGHDNEIQGQYPSGFTVAN